MESVLIVGAGPTGLIMALSLARRGVPVHLIDKKDGPARESRAMGLHARTLEFYRQFGFGDDLVDRGVIADTIQFRAGAEDASAPGFERRRIAHAGLEHGAAAVEEPVVAGQAAGILERR